MSQTSVGVDFTLETVQYKFASIIGELCGKPSVLSQFAVWLDLRLAEYKLKGSISLDCSGLKPNPEWLQGVKDSHVPVTAPAKSSGSPYARSRGSRERASSGHSVSHRTNHQRSSPEIVVIKEELSDTGEQGSVFPVGFHENSSSTPAIRKRHADEDLSDSSHKSQRFSSAVSQSPHNRLSDFSPHDQSISQLHPAEGVDSELEQFIQDNNFSRGHNSSTYVHQGGHDSASFVDQGGNNSAEFFSSSVLLDNSVSSESTHTGDVQSLKMEESHVGAGSSDAVDDTRYMTDAELVSGKQGARFTAMDTIRKTFSAVRGLQTWLLGRPTPDSRHIEKIPPAELDEYLAVFFSEIKTRDGGEYHPSSFNSLRSGIERYLQQSSYGHSIITSPEFTQSQQSYKTRKAALYKQDRPSRM